MSAIKKRKERKKERKRERERERASQPRIAAHSTTKSFTAKSTKSFTVTAEQEFHSKTDYYRLSPILFNSAINKELQYIFMLKLFWIGDLPEALLDYTQLIHFVNPWGVWKCAKWTFTLLCFLHRSLKRKKEKTFLVSVVKDTDL